MSRRRKLLKALSIASVPAATWSKPVVNSVLLPAHARTSDPETGPGCGAEAGCYTFELEGRGGVVSFSWPGGIGPFGLNLDAGTNCEGGFVDFLEIVVAKNEEAAADASQCASPGEIETVPAPAGGCRFFGCFAQLEV